MFDGVILKPIAIALVAMLLALGIFSVVQHFEITHLQAKNKTLEDNEQRRKDAAKAAEAANIITENANKQKTVQLEKDHANAIKQISAADTINADLQHKLDAAIKLRFSARRDSVPQTCASSGFNLKSIAPVIPDTCGKVLNGLVSEYRSLGTDAEKVRSTLITCQQFTGAK